MHEEPLEHRLILEAASQILAARPYTEVTLERIADLAGVTTGIVETTFGDVQGIATAVLDAESASMRHAQQAALEETGHPIDVLRRTFRYVGLNIATKPIVRAGIRIAAESREYFPERAIDPFQTWQKFIHSQLSLAKRRDLLRPEIDIDAVTWLLVSAGLGTKELARLHNDWDQFGHRLEAVLGVVLDLIVQQDLPMTIKPRPIN
ncbi:TetR family transcriptional regulator [Arthrobacter sp. 2RAF6]|uniref:TetR family transcriptional regulator n=1 Tax=Arthrobacter sp. 2RAF6 TaxID=3233002 RepID=UPI003F91B2B3